MEQSLLDFIDRSRVAELEALRPTAKSKRAGAVAAQERMRELRHEELRDTVQVGARG
jgi:hypothetical protein